MNETKQAHWIKRGWLIWYPHIFAGLAVPAVFVPLWLAYGQRMFAAVMAAIASLCLLTVLRLWQSRGRLSLAITAFVIPALVALVCVGAMKLTPLAARQATIDRLRTSDLQFTLRVPTVNGEWVHDQSGFLLPLWLAERIGPDCLTSVRRMSANLGDLQNFDYRSIPSEELTEIHITRESKSPRLSRDLAQWLATCQRAKIHIDLKHVTRDELLIIEQFPPHLLYEIILGFDGEIPGFALPGHPFQASFLGESISAAAASQLMAGRRERFLNSFHVSSISPEAIHAIGGNGYVRQLIWYGTDFETEDLEALRKQTIPYQGLYAISLPNAKIIDKLSASLPPRPTEVNDEKMRLLDLAVVDSQVSFAQLHALCKYLPYESISTDLVLSAENLQQCWAHTSLKKVTCVSEAEDGVLKRAVFERGSETPVQQYQLFGTPRDPQTGKVLTPMTKAQETDGTGSGGATGESSE